MWLPYAPENAIITLMPVTVHKKAENLLNREFKQKTSNTHWVEHWVGDITYIKT